MRHRPVPLLAAALILVGAAQAAAQGAGRTAIGFSAGIVPFHAASAGVSVSRMVLASRLAVRAQFESHSMTSDNVVYSAPCPSGQTCPSSPVRTMNQATVLGVGLELFEFAGRRGPYLVAKAGYANLTGSRPGSRDGLALEAGLGLMFPLGVAGIALEGRFVRFDIRNVNPRETVAATIGLLF